MDHNVFKSSKIILHKPNIVSRGRTKKLQVNIPRYNFLPQNTSLRPSGFSCRSGPAFLHDTYSWPAENKGRALQPLSGHLSPATQRPLAFTQSAPLDDLNGPQGGLTPKTQLMTFPPPQPKPPLTQY